MNGEGVITGNWEYVIAAYAVTYVGLVGYAISLWLRKPRNNDGGSS